MPFFGGGGGAPPGAARNSLAKYPANPNSAAPAQATLTPGRFAAPKAPPPAVAQRLAVPVAPMPRPQPAEQLNQWGLPGAMNPWDSVPGAPSIDTLGGASTGQDGLMDSVAATMGKSPAERAMRAEQRRMNRQAGRMSAAATAPLEATAMDEPAAPEEEPLTGANRPGMEYRRERRQAANAAPATGADRAGMGWRADRREAIADGNVARRAGGGFGFAGDAAGATGANRAGMDWRAQRRAAKPAAKPGGPGAPM